jgi:deazaflavin-dependent oxidoreductase (nitroreductase family)
MKLSQLVERLGATRAGVWMIKHVVAPLDRAAYRLSGGKRTLSRGRGGAVILLTTIGRKSGQPRTTPVFHLRDGERIVICNVNPGFEKTNPWVLNLRAHPVARVHIGGLARDYAAREATREELDRYWPQLVALWPAYQAHFDRSGERAVFVLQREGEVSLDRCAPVETPAPGPATRR